MLLRRSGVKADHPQQGDCHARNSHPNGREPRALIERQSNPITHFGGKCLCTTVQPDDEANMSVIRPLNTAKAHARPEALGIPTHPGHIMPSPTDLWHAHERGLVEIEHNRRRRLRVDKYAQQARHCAFSAFLRALSTSCSAIVATAHPDGWA